MKEWTDELMEVVEDWMRIHDIAVDEAALEELHADINDTLDWMMLMKMSAITGGRV